MAEPVVRVELTASFLERLAAIQAFLTAADAAFAYDELLAELRAGNKTQAPTEPTAAQGDQQ